MSAVHIQNMENAVGLNLGPVGQDERGGRDGGGTIGGPAWCLQWKGAGT